MYIFFMLSLQLFVNINENKYYLDYKSGFLGFGLMIGFYRRLLMMDYHSLQLNIIIILIN